MPNTLAPPRHPLLTGCPPSWASGWGRDRFGVFAEFSLPLRKTIVTQRLRWIPPGMFNMGSPKDEPGRYDDEGPAHEVTMRHGFWLFDTPCTQALWEAVTGENPSKFVDRERPVEQVTWHDCQDFIRRLAESIDGLQLALPTEAQWEYACRAGTTSATYAGDMEILGTNNAPILENIAWYGGNSGIDFDLNNGVDSSDWPEKSHEHTQAGTRKVAKKQPNPWGLYDMLGNVWEWCRDGMRDYTANAEVDPVGPLDEGAHRVIRGGGWSGAARYVRSAARFAYEPGNRNHYLGFRCALVQVPAGGARAE